MSLQIEKCKQVDNTYYMESIYNEYKISPIWLIFSNRDIERVYRDECIVKHRKFYLTGMILSLFSWINLSLEFNSTTSMGYQDLSSILVMILLLYLAVLITLILLNSFPHIHHHMCAIANLYAGHLIVYIGFKYQLYITVSAVLLAIAFFAFFIIRIRFYVAVPIVFSYIIYAVYTLIILDETLLPDKNNYMVSGPFVIFFICVMGGYYLERTSRELFVQRQIIKSLIYNTLPKEIADRMEAGEQGIVNFHDDVTIVFIDMVDFTTFAKSQKPTEVLTILNDLFSSFDTITQKYGGEKIKTIGDAYMLAFGVPSPIDNQSDRAVNCAKEMIECVEEYSESEMKDIKIRVGIHRGEVVAGVIGKKKYLYDLWGDSVNIASRLESHGYPNTIQLSEAVYIHLTDRNIAKKIDPIVIKGWGKIDTWVI